MHGARRRPLTRLVGAGTQAGARGARPRCRVKGRGRRRRRRGCRHSSPGGGGGCRSSSSPPFSFCFSLRKHSGGSQETPKPTPRGLLHSPECPGQGGKEGGGGGGGAKASEPRLDRRTLPGTCRRFRAPSPDEPVPPADPLSAFEQDGRTRTHVLGIRKTREIFSSFCPLRRSGEWERLDLLNTCLLLYSCCPRQAP